MTTTRVLVHGSGTFEPNTQSCFADDSFKIKTVNWRFWPRRYSDWYRAAVCKHMMLTVCVWSVSKWNLSLPLALFLHVSTEGKQSYRGSTEENNLRPNSDIKSINSIVYIVKTATSIWSNFLWKYLKKFLILLTNKPEVRLTLEIQWIMLLILIRVAFIMNSVINADSLDEVWDELCLLRHLLLQLVAVMFCTLGGGIMRWHAAAYIASIHATSSSC